MSSVTAIQIRTAAIELVSANNEQLADATAALTALQSRLAIQSRATRDGGLGFSAAYFVNTAALARVAATACTVAGDELSTKVSRAVLVSTWQSATKRLQSELEHLKAGKGTFAVSGGAEPEALTQFRVDLRAVVDATGAALRALKAASSTAAVA